MEPLRADDPRTTGGYRLLGLLGAGGMGRVYLARSPGGRTVAVKVIRPEFAGDPTFRTRFRREVEAARRVGGSWTAPVIDADPDAEQPYLVTGYVPGPSLLEAVRRRGPLPVSTVRALGAGLAEALSAVHAAGLVHRDLKPSNVLLGLDGPRVIDFGISRAFDATVLTHSGSAIGSPAFMSPEQIGGRDVGPASDVFALGSVLVFAATGSGPFSGSGMPAVMYGILTGEPRLDAVPAELRAVVDACLRKAPAERPGPLGVLAELAPGGGAAGLITTGWLPQDLVTGLSRQAVALLDLDAPVITSTNDHPTPEDHNRAQPWPPAPAMPTTPTRATPSGASRATPPGAPPAPSGAPVGPVARPGGGRRALVTVAALGVVCLAVIVTAVMTVALRGSDSDTGAGTGAEVSPGTTAGLGSLTDLLDHSTADPSAGGPPTPSGGSGPTVPGALPAGYAGTWEGPITSRLGVAQDVVITLRPGESGQTVGHAEVTLVGLGALGGGAPIRCVGDQQLVGISGAAGSGPEVVLRDIGGSGDNPTLLGLPVCTSGGTTRLRLAPDGALEYRSEDEAGGRPAGSLRHRP
ncbi:serine/threonine-protein kinase [Parafrankia discariae]|uniref:serine/threonine-protein kinase n=1 Tax=Parafrankia discariae TaxID=365528 RepID=UPI0003675272|nr:serine/threonine-protein kinase [Parafrankia discariae]